MGISLCEFCAALGDEVWRGLPGSSRNLSGSGRALYLLASGTTSVALPKGACRGLIHWENVG